LTANVDSISFNTTTTPNGSIVSTNGVFQDVNTEDNLASKGFSIRPEGSFWGVIESGYGKQSNFDFHNGAVSLGEKFFMQSTFKVSGGPYLGGVERLITWRNDVFNFEEYDKEPRYTVTEILAEKIKTTYKYGVYNKDKSNGPTTDSEVENAFFDDFTWYDTADEARRNGKLAAIYIYDPNHTGFSVEQVKYRFYMSVTDDAKYLGTTQMFRQRVRIYPEVNKGGYPYNYWGKDVKYVKSEYDGKNIVNTGTPYEIGNTFLIVPYQVRINTTVSDVDNVGEPKKVYDVAEECANLKITNALIFSSSKNKSVLIFSHNTP